MSSPDQEVFISDPWHSDQGEEEVDFEEDEEENDPAYWELMSVETHQEVKDTVSQLKSIYGEENVQLVRAFLPNHAQCAHAIRLTLPLELVCSSTTSTQFIFLPSDQCSLLLLDLSISGGQLSVPITLSQTCLPAQFHSTTAHRVSPEEAQPFPLRWACEKRLEDHIRNHLHPVISSSHTTHALLDHIMQLLQALDAYASQATSRCLICDAPLPEMPKPSVCEQSLCVFASEELGLAGDLILDLKSSPQVIDLLLTITFSCLMDSQAPKIFHPQPLFIRPSSSTSTFAEDGGVASSSSSSMSDNLAHWRSVLNLMPCVTELSNLVDSEKTLREVLMQSHPDLFSLLRWIVRSNRACLEYLSPSDPGRFSEDVVQTPHQFRLTSASPAREAWFQNEKLQHGSFFAWHGSPFENWHPILRQGLRCLSGTSLQRHGAAFGNGIYLSPHFGTSATYAIPRSSWPLSSMFAPAGMGGSLCCLALCEVINRGYTANPHYVIPNDQDIITRYFFVYTRLPHLSLSASELMASIAPVVFDQQSTSSKKKTKKKSTTKK